VRKKTVLELGCGAALPSLVASRLGASRVIATDVAPAMLQQVQNQASQNDCPVKVIKLDWDDDETVERIQADVLLAADVIYGVSQVPALVGTVDRHLASEGSAVIATREGRRGIEEFRLLMDQRGFQETNSQSFTEEDMKQWLELDEQSSSRWKGGHTIYTYLRRAAVRQSDHHNLIDCNAHKME